MKVSKKEFYWACHRLVPKLLEAKLKGVNFSVPDLVNSCASVAMSERLDNKDNTYWNFAVDTVSVVAKELANDGYYSFSEVDCFVYPILSMHQTNQFENEFWNKQGE